VESKQNKTNKTPKFRARDQTGGYLRWQVGEGDWRKVDEGSNCPPRGT